MEEGLLNQEKPPREEVVAALRAWSADAASLLTRYMDGIRERYGETDEGRFHAEYEQVKIYIDAGLYDEAEASVEDILEAGVALGEEWNNLLRALLDEINSHRVLAVSRENN